MRAGLFGGCFDPIHMGHIAPVRHAREVLALERVIYLPTARPPHKSGPAAAAHARFTMVELALLGEDGLYASPFEMREETCYTVDTVEHFAKQLPGAELVLLLGTDAWASFTRYFEWRRILAQAELAVLVRPGWETGPLAAPFDEALEKGRLRFVENEPWPVSSTELRALFEAGREIPAGRVPPLVLDYIEKYGLYRPT